MLCDDEFHVQHSNDCTDGTDLSIHRTGMGADPRAVLMACVIGGSCAYVTPIGMPANTMVVGAGNYKFIDYVKSGLPLIVIATVISMIILPIAFPFYP